MKICIHHFMNIITLPVNIKFCKYVNLSVLLVTARVLRSTLQILEDSFSYEFMTWEKGIYNIISWQQKPWHAVWSGSALSATRWHIAPDKALFVSTEKARYFFFLLLHKNMLWLLVAPLSGATTTEYPRVFLEE